MTNAFGRGNAKAILNGNDVLGYNSIVQRSINTIIALPYFINLGRASMLDISGGVFPIILSPAIWHNWNDDFLTLL